MGHVPSIQFEIMSFKVHLARPDAVPAIYGTLLVLSLKKKKTDLERSESTLRFLLEVGVYGAV